MVSYSADSFPQEMTVEGGFSSLTGSSFRRSEGWFISRNNDLFNNRRFYTRNSRIRLTITLDIFLSYDNHNVR